MTRAVIAALLAAAPALAADGAPTATARMTGPNGGDRGTVELTQWPSGVLIRVELDGIAPGVHGFHIHETGECAPEFSAAGGHFNPGGGGHGLSTEGGGHAGDLPNVHVGIGAKAVLEYWTDRVTLTGGDAALMDADGAAIIVHDGPDSYGEEAGAGVRVACGVIEMGG